MGERTHRVPHRTTLLSPEKYETRLPALTKRKPRPQNRGVTPSRHSRAATPLQALTKTACPGPPLLARGKVRDLYAVGEALLLIATDRISAFDHVLGTGIPGKGKILTQDR